MGLKILQIGTHSGHDDLTEIVKKYDPKDVEVLILVEPQYQFNPTLLECYSEYNPIIENIVISISENEGKIKFYHSNETEVSSVNPNHLKKHGQFIFKESEFQCMTLNNLLLKYNLTELDILFIDAEGIDDKIIMSIDFNRFNIDEIFYENLHINNKNLEDFLKSKNYNIISNILLNGWTNKAKKNNT
jgi:FkbM family methyltransferase